MKETTALITSTDDNSIVVKEANTWLTNFVSNRTRDTYKKAIEEFAKFAELEKPDDLYDIDSSTVLAWREHLIGLELSNNSVANRLSALSSLFKHLCDKQIVQTNPVQGLVPDEAGETVGILLRDGTHKYFRWCGLMTRSQVKLFGGRSVKLAISRVDDRWLAAGEYVQGCLLPEGVYGIIDTEVSVISHSPNNPPVTP